MFKLFFDTEFTGLHKDTTLISIGIISDKGDSFYAELTDYDKSQINDWINDNVIENLYLNSNNTYLNTSREIELELENQITQGTNLIYELRLLGSKKFIRNGLEIWLKKIYEREQKQILMVSDVCHYDFVLFIDLFGDAFSLPEFICPYCHDINNDIARYFNINEYEAFDYNREQILDKLVMRVITGYKHNAFYDAAVIKAIYEKINKV